MADPGIAVALFLQLGMLSGLIWQVRVPPTEPGTGTQIPKLKDPPAKLIVQPALIAAPSQAWITA